MNNQNSLSITNDVFANIVRLPTWPTCTLTSEKRPTDENRMILKLLFILRMKYYRSLSVHPEPLVLERRLKIMPKSMTIDRRFHERLPSLEAHIRRFFAHCEEALTIHELVPFHNGNCQVIDVKEPLSETGLRHGDTIYVDCDLWFDLSKMPYLN